MGVGDVNNPGEKRFTASSGAWLSTAACRGAY
jgi:hypothetical protein